MTHLWVTVCFYAGSLVKIRVVYDLRNEIQGFVLPKKGGLWMNWRNEIRVLFVLTLEIWTN